MDMYRKREMRRNKKMNKDEKSLPSTNINWYPGHMAKTRKQIQEDFFNYMCKVARVERADR